MMSIFPLLASQALRSPIFVLTMVGSRATARTLICELLGWDREVIERHLAHVSDEELGGSYDRATHLEQRRQMVQMWADLLDDLMAGKAVQPAQVHRFQVGRPAQSKVDALSERPAEKPGH